MIDLVRSVKRLERKSRNTGESGISGRFPLRAVMWHDEAIVTVGNAMAKTIDAAQSYAFYMIRTPSSGDGDAFTNGCFLAAGTYTLSVLGATMDTAGKADYLLDGVSISTGQDWYSASITRNVVKTIADVVVTYSGWHALTVTVNGKNGSSSAYRIPLTKYWFTPSAD